MLKKYFLALLLLVLSSNVYASFWGDVGQCITDPCNCGVSEIEETWNGQVIRKILPGSVCPPYNRRDGREKDNCLNQFNWPGNFTPYYFVKCAQNTKESTYFAPKIHVRSQACMEFACWSLSSSLKWDGQCVVWPGPYGLPMARICARIAVPEVPPDPSGLNKTGTPADQGYTKGEHLNYVGATEADTPVLLEDGTSVLYESPKLCAYSDPGLVNLVSDTGAHVDLMDWNPTNQILHKTDKLHPLIKVLIFLVDNAAGNNPASMLASVLDMIGADAIPGIDLLQEVLKAVGTLFDMFAGIIVGILETIGTLNNSVDINPDTLNASNYKLGCVELPFGPFPPPYCPDLSQMLMLPSIQNICSTKNPDGSYNQTSVDIPCVGSKVNNNIVNNSVRISVDNLVPLCTTSSADLKKCVKIKGAVSTAKAMHVGTVYTDLLKPCSTAASGAPCFETEVSFKCGVTQNGCNDGYRVVYTQKLQGASSSKPSNYYISDIDDCPGTRSVCQDIWGINVGEFVDASVTFPMNQGQTPQDFLPIEKSLSLAGRSFNMSIVKTPTPKDSFQQEPTDICVFDSDELVGCNQRVNTGYKILTYECGGHAGITCPNQYSPEKFYFRPQFIASIQVQDASNNIINETNAVVTPLAVNPNPAPSGQTEAIITLAGYNFTSFMAYIPDPSDPKYPRPAPNDKYTAMPFSGVNSFNQLSIFGKYKDDKVPYTIDNSGKFTEDTSAVYLTGLEYINGKYMQGGTDGCLLPKTFEHCAPGIDNTNCVLSQLLARDTVDCENFKALLTSSPNLSICPSDLTGCSPDKDFSGLPGKQGLKIYKCANNSSCYQNKDNPGNEVCSLSRETKDRVDPSANLGPQLTTDQYFKQATVDKKKEQDVRDKTSQELGLCAKISLPKCAAITTPTPANGNALWPEAEVGEISYGKCPDKWVTIDPKPDALQRYCLANVNNETIALEPLDPNEGCRESTGINIPPPDTNIDKNRVPIRQNYDENTKIGFFELNKEPVNGAFPDDVKIMTSGIYYVNFTFEIEALINDVEYFKILKVAYDDCVLIKINGDVMLAEPNGTRDPLTSLANCNNGNDQGHSEYSRAVPIDVLSKLRKGTNTIQFQLGVNGGGGLYYYMEYKMKR